MHDTSTVLCCDVVARYHAEGVALNLEERYQLLIAQTNEVGSCTFAQKCVGWKFLTVAEMGRHEVRRQNVNSRNFVIRILRRDNRVLYLRTDTQSGVRCQSPWGCRPSQRIGCSLRDSLLQHIRHRGRNILASKLELRSDSRVLHVAVASRLVQLVAAQSGSCRRRIWLDCVTLVKQPLVEQLLKQPPQSLDVLILVSNVRVLCVNPVAHLMGKLGPLLSELHDIAAASRIVLLDSYLLADVFLGDAESLLHTELNRQSVSVPSCLAVNLEALHRLVTADDVLDGTSQNVVNARHSVCRRRSFIENERRMTFFFLYRTMEHVFFVPVVKHFAVHLSEVQLAVLFEFFCHMKFKFFL